MRIDQMGIVLMANGTDGHRIHECTNTEIEIILN